MNSQLRNLIIAIVAVTVLFFGYRYFFSSTPAPAIESSGPKADASIQEGKDFLVALINLQHINLDAGAALFNEDSFARLRDMSVSLPDEPRGRPNPFKSIGDDKGVSQVSTTSVLGGVKIPVI